MKRLIKISVIIASILIILAVALSLFLKLYLNEERIRAHLLHLAEGSLHRQVSLGPVQVSLWRGIVVSDLEVKERDSPDSFLRMKRLVLKYQLLPLLSRRLVIDDLHLIEPQIHIKRGRDGSFNFSDFGRPEGTAPAKEVKGAKAPGVPLTLAILTLSLQKALLEYEDPGGDLKKMSLSVDADLSVASKAPDVLWSKGKIVAVIGEVLLKGKGEVWKDLPFTAAYDLEADMASKRILLHSVDAQVMKIPVNLEGEVGYGDRATLDLVMRVPEVRLATIKGITARFLPEGTDLAGALSLALKVSRGPSKAAQTDFVGEVHLREVAFSGKGIRPVFNGAIHILPQRISLEGFHVEMQDSGADVLGYVENYSRMPDIRIDLHSKMLNLDRIIPAASATPGKQRSPVDRPVPRKEKRELEPVKLGFKAGGSVEIEKALYRGVVVQNLRADYALKDSILRVSSFRGDTMSGSFAGQSTLDLSQRGTRYALKTLVRDIRFEDLASAFAPKWKDSVSGTLQAQVEISGAGTAEETIRRNLRGRGTFSVKDGTFKNDALVSSLLALLGIQELREIKVQGAEGSFSIGDGAVNLASSIAGQDLILEPNGTIDLDGRLDVDLTAKVSERLAPKLLGRSSPVRFLSREKGWSSIPLRLEGTLSQPSYVLDTKSLAETASREAAKRLEEELLKTISRHKEKEKKKETKGSEKKGQGVLQDLLKGVLGE